MAVINGASPLEMDGNPLNYHSDAIGNNSEVFASGDIVSISGAASSKTLGVAAAVSSIVGVVAKTATMTSTNKTVAKVQPLYVPASPETLFLMGSNADFTSTLADAGTYYKLTGATGAQQVDQSSGVQTTTSRIVEIVEVDPFNDGGTGSGSGLRKVVVRFVKTPWYNLNTG